MVAHTHALYDSLAHQHSGPPACCPCSNSSLAECFPPFDEVWVELAPESWGDYRQGQPENVHPCVITGQQRASLAVTFGRLALAAH